MPQLREDLGHRALHDRAVGFVRKRPLSFSHRARIRAVLARPSCW
jgi:hypothetical protein